MVMFSGGVQCHDVSMSYCSTTMRGWGFYSTRRKDNLKMNKKLEQS